MRAYLATLGSILFVAACSGEDVTPDAGVPADGGNAVADSGVAIDAGPEPCESWIIEYDLTGSEFETRNTPFGAGDAINEVGPGRVQLRFPGDDDGPQAGEVIMLHYSMEMEFEIMMVETDVTATAGPNDCGVAMGTRTASVVTWSTPMTEFSSVGTVTCRAGEFLCGAAGLPENEPVAQNSTDDQALSAFYFAGDDDFSSFTMPDVEVPNDAPGDTFLRLVGTQTSARCARLPMCE